MGQPQNQCLSDFRLDRWLAHELSASDSAAVEAHLRACHSCHERAEHLITFRDRFMAAPPPIPWSGPAAMPKLRVIEGGRSGTDATQPEQLSAQSPAETAPPIVPIPSSPPERRHAAHAYPRRRKSRPKPRNWPRGSAIMLTTAAAALLVLSASELRRTATQPTQLAKRTASDGPSVAGPAAPDLVHRGDNRTKGTHGGNQRMSAYLVHGGVVTVARNGAPAYPGDQLQLTYTTDTDGYLAIFSLDGAGVASVYYDDGAASARSAAITAGADVPLPHSIILDDALGTETLYALFCPEPVATVPLRERLQQTGTLPQPDGDGCHIETATLDKRPGKP